MLQATSGRPVVVLRPMTLFRRLRAAWRAFRDYDGRPMVSATWPSDQSTFWPSPPSRGSFSSIDRSVLPESETIRREDGSFFGTKGTHARMMISDDPRLWGRDPVQSRLSDEAAKRAIRAMLGADITSEEIDAAFYECGSSSEFAKRMDELIAVRMQAKKAIEEMKGTP